MAARETWHTTSSAAASVPLPASFVAFLRDNSIDEALFEHAYRLPRFIRMNPARPVPVAVLADELQCTVLPTGLANFYQLDGSVKIAHTPSYKNGHIYGMDLASGAAVVALDVQPGDTVLDLCCAPGAKLCMIADLLQGGVDASPMGSVTGVDIVPHRLATCRTLVCMRG
jgi:16S rRNA C967 or C1407 C5-methylase (RsmB/RsmF family)